MSNESINTLNMEACVTPETAFISDDTTSTLKKAGLWLADRIPTLVILGGFAAYYISLSFLG